MNHAAKKVVKVIECREPKSAPRTGSTAKRRRTSEPTQGSIIVARSSSGRVRKAS